MKQTNQLHDTAKTIKSEIRTIGKRLAAALPGMYTGSGCERLPQLFYNCFINTIDTTMCYANGKPFVITGDIPAMWLRDSSAQVKHYLPYLSRSTALKQFIRDLIRQQFLLICIDPYANAFNSEPSGAGHQDETEKSPWVWERKYEVDSLCYAISLLEEYIRLTGDNTIVNDAIAKGVRLIVDTWILEQNHANSSYQFIRKNCPDSDTLPFDGFGSPVSYTGMTWSGFRPSDDACQYGYLIPANLFAIESLHKLLTLQHTLLLSEEEKAKIITLKQNIQTGIDTFGIVTHPKFGKIYAYETDGLGNYLLMDDANVPSLLSIPYLTAAYNTEIYANTRKFILSDANPYYYAGKKAKGIGSPHTPAQYIWHIALSMQGLTSQDPIERRSLLEMLVSTDAGTGYLHEGFHPDNPTQFTREWFAWSNSIFAEYVCDLLEKGEC